MITRVSVETWSTSRGQAEKPFPIDINFFGNLFIKVSSTIQTRQTDGHLANMNNTLRFALKHNAVNLPDCIALHFLILPAAPRLSQKLAYILPCERKQSQESSGVTSAFY